MFSIFWKSEWAKKILWYLEAILTKLDLRRRMEDGGCGMSFRRQCMLMGSWVTRSLMQSVFCFLPHNCNYPLPSFLWWADKEVCIWSSENTNDNQTEFLLCCQTFLSGKMQCDYFSHLYVCIYIYYFQLICLKVIFNFRVYWHIQMGVGNACLHAE